MREEVSGSAIHSAGRRLHTEQSFQKTKLLFPYLISSGAMWDSMSCSRTQRKEENQHWVYILHRGECGPRISFFNIGIEVKYFHFVSLLIEQLLLHSDSTQTHISSLIHRQQRNNNERSSAEKCLCQLCRTERRESLCSRCFKLPSSSAASGCITSLPSESQLCYSLDPI